LASTIIIARVARLKDFELSAIKLNNNKVEVITSISKTPPTSTAQKSTVGSDELLASYIDRLERSEDLEKDKNIAFNNNETSSSAFKINPHEVVYPSLSPLPITNNANFTYGMPPETPIGHTLPFQPRRPSMATPVGPL
jgi:hypothetical protein